MRFWMNAALRTLAAFGASWGGAVWFWRNNGSTPSNGELIAFLLVVPLALLAVWWGVRKLLAARAPAPAEPAPVAVADSAPPALPSLAILASALRTPHGSSADDLAAALGEQRARADLDPELLDDAGYPVMSARADAAIDPLAGAEIDAWLAASGLPDPGWSPQQRRALALGTAVAAELALYAAGHPHATAPAGAPAPPLLRVLAHVTPDWSTAQCAAAAAWLEQVAIQAGWPAARVQAVLAPGTGARAPGPLLDELARQANAGAAAAAGQAPLLVQLLAFGSTIGMDSVDQLSMQGLLFGADNPQGLIPGEGAAGLLLADAAQAGLFGPQAPTLQAVSAARTVAPGKDARRPDPAQLKLLAAQLLPDPASASAVGAVYADSGHRSVVLMELMEFAHAAVPQVDPSLDLKTTGAACGHCGDAAFLAALALAHRHAQDAAEPALCIANEHPLNRTAVLVRPAAALS